MISVLSKPTDQIGVADIQELIDSQVPEGQQIEFKADSLKDGDSAGTWLSGGRPIREPARNKILEETVAFTNAYGGAVVLGIAESKSKPPVAARICPIRKCAELAEQLKLVFRDCVDPQIPSLEIVAVPTDGDDGVVVIRVGKSRMAPHRVEPTGKCTIRRADRREKMTMREIQDLTLNTSRGLARMERSLADRAEIFREGFERLRSPENSHGIRVTATPVRDEIKFNRVYGHTELYRPNFEIDLLGKCNVVRAEDHSLWRPMLRAARADTSVYGKQSSYSYEEITCDGIVEKSSYVGDSVLALGDAVANFASVSIWVDNIKKFSSNPMSEYAIDVEIDVRGQDLIVTAGSSHRRFPGMFVHEEIGED